MYTRASPLKLRLTPPARKRLCYERPRCGICNNVKKESLSLAGPNGRSALETTAKIRDDANLKQILSPLEASEDMKQIHYHRSCYQNYTRVRDPYREAVHDSCDPTIKSTRTQTSPPLSDWSLCLVCRSGKRKSTEMRRVKTSDRQDSIRRAAKERGDLDMLGRIEAVDLIKEGAVYHNGCMSTYTSKEHIKRLQQKTDEEDTHEEATDVYKLAFTMLIEEIDVDLQGGKAFRLKDLAERYNNLLPKTCEVYHSQLLQRRLERHYGDKIITQSQQGQGKSTIIMSSDIQLKDAIKAFAAYKEKLTLNQASFGIAHTPETQPSDTLHQVIGHLRQDISSIDKMTDYPTAAEVGIEASEKFVPASLTRALLWLLDDGAFNSADPNYKPSKAVWRRVLSLAECIIYCSQYQVTPLHLGLATQLYHDYGKRDIIETLNAHGFVLSSDELRRFITSVGEKEQQRNQEDVYIPYGLTPCHAGGAFIQEGANNIDINCRTIDGKGTFHAMARVVFQQQATNVHRNHQRIPHSRSKTLRPNENKIQILPYKKPTHRTEPPRGQNVVKQLEDLKMTVTYQAADLSWVLMRSAPRQERIPACDMQLTFEAKRTPFWTGFNAQVADKSPTKTVSAYTPIIDAKPTDSATVYSAMISCRDLSHTLGQ